MTRADRPRLRTLLGTSALLLAGVLSGCSETAASAPAAVEPTAPEPLVSSYVALGDSFTAAPFVPSTALAEGCFRSSGNYPALLAEELAADLRDVSCSGAATADLTGPQAVGFGEEAQVPSQLKAIRRSTDLVTVGIGGNDENLFGTLVQQCTAVARQPGSPCTELLRDSYGEPENVLDVVGRRVAGVLRKITERAPAAQVVLVGYPRLVDESGSCPAMPLAEGDLPLVARLEEGLNRTLGRAARTVGAEYVDMYAVSKGHEVCSEDPWVNGRRTDDEKALAFHPFAEGQQAVADELLALLTP